MQKQPNKKFPAFYEQQRAFGVINANPNTHLVLIRDLLPKLFNLISIKIDLSRSEPPITGG